MQDKLGNHLLSRNDIHGFKIKINQRITNIPSVESLRVLDAYAGEGKIWNEIKSKYKGIIQVISLEKTKGLNEKNIVGNNLYWMQRNNLKQFDVIDLDHYSCPYLTLCEVFNQKYKGLIFFTFIQTGLGTLLKDMLLDLYGNNEIAKRSHTLFAKNGIEIFLSWLYKKGVEKVNYTGIKTTGSRKYYGYFTI